MQHPLNLTALSERLRSYRREAGDQDEGQTLVEYALILVLIAIVVIVVLVSLGGQISSVFGSLNESL